MQKKEILQKVDKIVSKVLLKFSAEKGLLITVLIHRLYGNLGNLNLSSFIRPKYTTFSDLRFFIEYFKNLGYTFVSPQDIINRLDPKENFVMITFDDGYYNNILSLPLLKKYEVPAVFFPSINHILQNKCFWWDVLYRERKKQGFSEKTIIREENFLKVKKTRQIERYLVKKFGKNSFKPKNDFDRPFTLDELKEFSKERLVNIGNHTLNHAILTNYSLNEIKDQIFLSQARLKEFTGTKPIIISYPNGNYSEDIICIAKEADLKLGITVNLKNNRLPLNFRKNDHFKISRFIVEKRDYFPVYRTSRNLSYFIEKIKSFKLK